MTDHNVLLVCCGFICGAALAVTVMALMLRKYDYSDGWPQYTPEGDE